MLRAAAAGNITAIDYIFQLLMDLDKVKNANFSELDEIIEYNIFDILQVVEVLAEIGNIQAMNILSKVYLEGIGVSHDLN